MVRSSLLVLLVRDTSNKIEGFQYAIRINISIGYLHIKLDTKL